MISTPYLIAVIATLAAFANAATDYCNLKSCDGSTHTMCESGFRQGFKCRTLHARGFTANETQEILNLHNSYRARVASGQERLGSPGPQPAATNLGSLSWDQELANIAQTWADQCTFELNLCGDCERFPVGQNIFWKGEIRGYSGKYTDMVSMWYSEVRNFNRNQVRSVTDYTGVSHYTQMMWADTKFLGCGGVHYNDGQTYNTLFVCNYGPAGNYLGGQMYNPR